MATETVLLAGDARKKTLEACERIYGPLQRDIDSALAAINFAASNGTSGVEVRIARGAVGDTASFYSRMCILADWMHGFGYRVRVRVIYVGEGDEVGLDFKWGPQSAES